MPTYVPQEAKHTIRDLRIRANMSQVGAAKALGISEPTLRKWENDSSSLTFRDMQRIAELYNIPLDYIFLVHITLLAKNRRCLNWKTKKKLSSR
ncbi:helix-turn-helix transcriptional regulator [Limosilactobacillus fermentum]